MLECRRRVNESGLKPCVLGQPRRWAGGQQEHGCQGTQCGFAFHKHLLHPYYRSKLLVAFGKMKADLSIPELLALVEIVDEHVDRNFPGVDPPRLLREVQQKLDAIIIRHHKEVASVTPLKKKSARR